MAAGVTPELNGATASRPARAVRGCFTSDHPQRRHIDDATDETVDAVASSINIRDRDEATRLVHTVAPHYRNGRLTPTGLLAACRLLYAGFDRYASGTKAALAREARAILALGENSRTQTGADQSAA